MFSNSEGLSNRCQSKSANRAIDRCFYTMRDLGGDGGVIGLAWAGLEPLPSRSQETSVTCQFFQRDCCCHSPSCVLHRESRSPSHQPYISLAMAGQY